MRQVLAFVLLAFLAPIHAATFYVRTDGGTATQCTGKADARYPGSGTAQACAWSNPLVALPPGGPARIQGGDSLLIRPGVYRIGLGAPGAASPACASAYPWDCKPTAVPSGSTWDTRTKVLGDCAAPPKLTGVERVGALVNLTGSANVEIACLELTDGAACAELLGTGAMRCPRDAAPFGPWASVGIEARGAGRVLLRDLNVHGLANTGVLAGGVRDWTLERVRIAGNAWAGWNGDVGANSSNAGALTFVGGEIAWNGCVEDLTGKPVACYGQEAGGYGDGLGTGKTGGDWTFDGTSFHHNTSDGLDLLYADGSGSITVRRARFEANAGNQVKVRGAAAIVDSVIVGTCGYFATSSTKLLAGENCRALGNSISVALTSALVTLDRNQVSGQGDCLLLTSGGDGTARVVVTGNTFEGLPSGDLTQPGTKVCGWYADAAGATHSWAANTWANVKDGTAPANSAGGNTTDPGSPGPIPAWEVEIAPGKRLSCRIEDVQS